MYVTENELITLDAEMRTEARQRHRDLMDQKFLDDIRVVMDLMETPNQPPAPFGPRHPDVIYHCPLCAHDF